MSLLFSECPLPAEIGDILKQDCPDNFGQIVKIAFWRKGAAPFTASTILLSATWATATAAADNTKVVVTNYLGVPITIPQSTVVEQTSDTNILAMPERQRLSNPNVTGSFRSMSADRLKEIDALSPYTQIQPGVTGLVGVFINTDNQIIYNKSRADLGFDIFGMAVTDNDAKPIVAGLNEAQLNFYLKGGWSRDAAKLSVVAFDLLNTYPVSA